MAKRRTRVITRYVRRGYRRSKGMTFSLAVIAGLAPAAYRAYEGFTTDGIRGAAYRLSNDFTGFDPYQRKWNPWEMKYGLLPALLGIGVHKVAGKLGINRALAQAGIPFIRI